MKSEGEKDNINGSSCAFVMTCLLNVITISLKCSAITGGPAEAVDESRSADTVLSILRTVEKIL